MARKTFDIDEFVDMINFRILNSEDDRKQARAELGTMAEIILMKANRYRGFNYLDSRDMRKSQNGMSVGINDDGTFEDTDHTRVFYYK